MSVALGEAREPALVPAAETGEGEALHRAVGLLQVGADGAADARERRVERVTRRIFIGCSSRMRFPLRYPGRTDSWLSLA
jgi:hypothetical protein